MHFLPYPMFLQRQWSVRRSVFTCMYRGIFWWLDLIILSYPLWPHLRSQLWISRNFRWVIQPVRCYWNWWKILMGKWNRFYLIQNWWSGNQHKNRTVGDIPANSFAAGVPARVICEITEEDSVKNMFEEIYWQNMWLYRKTPEQVMKSVPVFSWICVHS